jgi:hypothetical protein
VPVLDSCNTLSTRTIIAFWLCCDTLTVTRPTISTTVKGFQNT